MLSARLQICVQLVAAVTGWKSPQYGSVVVATKFGFVRSDDPDAPAIDNSPDYIRRSCEGSLRRLGVDAIDLYYVHRVDPARPIEDTMGVMADLVKDMLRRALDAFAKVGREFGVIR